MYYLSKVFLMFLIYSVIGYIVEVASVSLIEKKLVLSRGFLIGPYIPIFGVGAVLMTNLLTRYEEDVIVLFIMSTIICTTLEYITSVVMEKIFKLRWWDYSDKSFNLNGRVCLSTGMLFGLGGVVVIKIINPILYKLVSRIPEILLIILAIILGLLFLSDLIVTVYIMTKLKINVSKFEKKDATQAIKQEIQAALKKNTILTGRLLKAFPDISRLNNQNFKNFEDLFNKTKEEVKRLKIEYKVKKANNNIRTRRNRRE